MKKLFFIGFLFINLMANAQFYNNYHYNSPIASMSIDDWDASSVDITYQYQPNGCKMEEIRLDIYAGGVYSRSEYFSVSNAVSTTVSTTIYGLSGSTVYTLYLWVYNCYSPIVPNGQFTTPSGTTETPPSVSTSSASDISYGSFTANGNVTNEGSSSVVSRGFKYWMIYEPNNVYTVTSGSGSGSFTSSISGLYTAQPYKYEAFATNNTGTSYGSIVDVQLSAPSGGQPTVTTTTATNITTGSATSGGNVTSDGNAPVTNRGICYGTSANPTSQNQSGNGIGVFSYVMSYLSPSTTYYYRAYATNSYGTSYGSEYNFTTASITAAPTVVTNAATSILAHGFTTNGNITNGGSSSVTSRGFVYSTTNTDPDLGESGVTNIPSGSGTGTFSSTIYNGSTIYCNQTIYYKAYAINTEGTSYGSVSSFTTSSESFTDERYYITSITQTGKTINITSLATALEVVDSLRIVRANIIRTISAPSYRVLSFANSNQIHYVSLCKESYSNAWHVTMPYGSSSPYATLHTLKLESGVITNLTAR